MPVVGCAMRTMGIAFTVSAFRQKHAGMTASGARGAPYKKLLAVNGLEAYVLSAIHILPADFAHHTVGEFLRFCHVVAQCAHTEYASTTGNNLAILFCGAGVKYFGVGDGGCIKAADDIALVVMIGITTGSQYHAE